MPQTIIRKTLAAKVMVTPLPTQRWAPLGVALALAEAEVGRAAVPHAPAEGHGDHQQGEDHPRGGVAQVPQLTVADEDLIDDVVQSADEQRQDAGQGEGAQQFSQVVSARMRCVRVP